MKDDLIFTITPLISERGSFGYAVRYEVLNPATGKVSSWTYDNHVFDAMKGYPPARKSEILSGWIEHLYSGLDIKQKITKYDYADYCIYSIKLYRVHRLRFYQGRKFICEIRMNSTGKYWINSHGYRLGDQARQLLDSLKCGEICVDRRIYE
jgi:hypothetical protein